MLYCYCTIPIGGCMHRAMQTVNPSPEFVHPTFLCPTREAAWEDSWGSGCIMVRWEWHGEIDKDGCWLLTSPQPVG